MAEDFKVEYKQEGIAPFWQKLPFFFLFPFRPAPLIFMVCIILASALAGFALGSFGLMYRGILVYLGLRYAFNVLDLFSSGRFEGHSPDHSLWGPEKRPAKFGLAVFLFVVISLTIGNSALSSRAANNLGVQEKLITVYKSAHAEEIAERDKENAAITRQNDQARAREKAAEESAHLSPNNAEREGDDSAESAADRRAAFESELAPIDQGPSREEMIVESLPRANDPLWYALQPAWFWLVVVAFSMLLPAIVIVIALEDKFFKALNPIHVVSLTKTMGGAYFVLWGFFILIAGTRQLAFTAGGNLPMALRFPLEMSLATYLGLVLFSTLGYVLYQFHQELSLDVTVDFDSHREAGGVEAIAKSGSAHLAIRAKEPTDPFERKLQGLIAAGDIDEAIAEIKDRMRYDRTDPDLNTRLFELYKAKGDSAAMLSQGPLWLTGLIKAGRANEAATALSALLVLDAGFTVQDGDVILPTTVAAIKKRDYPVALSLVKHFDKRFPKHKDTAGILFQCAKIASEHLRQQAKAISLLQSLLKHFPDDPAAQEAEVYLKVLQASVTPKTPA